MIQSKKSEKKVKCRNETHCLTNYLYTILIVHISIRMKLKLVFIHIKLQS